MESAAGGLRVTAKVRKLQLSPISRPYLAHISRIARPYLAHISPHLAHTSLKVGKLPTKDDDSAAAATALTQQLTLT